MRQNNWRRARSIALIAALALCCALALSCFRSEVASSLTVRGRVRESQGARRPIAGATITLSGGGLVARAESRADGSYEVAFPQPPVWPLTLTAHKFGYEPPHTQQLNAPPAGDVDVALAGPVTYSPAQPTGP